MMTPSEHTTITSAGHGTGGHAFNLTNKSMCGAELTFALTLQLAGYSISGVSISTLNSQRLMLEGGQMAKRAKLTQYKIN